MFYRKRYKKDREEKASRDKEEKASRKKEKKNNRRDFFRTIVKKNTQSKITLIRPPYSKNKSDFLRCISCIGPCLDACENKIIVFSYYNTPYIDFRLGGCTFCDKCWQVCEKGVLQEDGLARIQALFEINRHICVSWEGEEGDKLVEECDKCESSCSEKAILFYNRKNPYIDTNSCTGCGFCLPSCPHKAINIFNLG